MPSLYVEPLLVAAQQGPDMISDILGFSTHKLQMILHAIAKLLLEEKTRLSSVEEKLASKASSVDVIEDLSLIKQRVAALERTGAAERGQALLHQPDTFGIKAAEELLARLDALERRVDERLAAASDEVLVLTGRVAKMEADRELWEEEVRVQGDKVQRAMEEVRDMRREVARKADHSQLQAVDNKIDRLEGELAALQRAVLELRRETESRVSSAEREVARTALKVDEVYTDFKVLQAASSDASRQCSELYVIKADVAGVAGKADREWVDEGLRQLRADMNTHLFEWADDVSRLRTTLERVGLMMASAPSAECGPEGHVPPIAGRMHFRCISCDQVVHAGVPPPGAPTPAKLFSSRDALREALGGREVPLVGKGAIYRGRYYVDPLASAPSSAPAGAPGEDPFPPGPGAYSPTDRPATSGATAGSPNRYRIKLPNAVPPGGQAPRKPSTAPQSAR